MPTGYGAGEEVIVPDTDPSNSKSNGGATTPLYLRFEDAMNISQQEVSKLVLEFGLSHSDVLSQPEHVLRANLDKSAGVLELEIV